MNFRYIYVTDDKKRSPPFSVEAKNLGHALQQLASQLSDAVEVQVWRTATVHRIGTAAGAPDAA